MRQTLASALRSGVRKTAVSRTDPVPTRLPPGPRLPTLVQALHIATRPTRFLHDCARRFGDCFILRLPVFGVDASGDDRSHSGGAAPSASLPESRTARWPSRLSL